MNSIGGALLVCLSLFLAMLAAAFTGHVIGARRVRSYGEQALAGGGGVEAAVFALLGLLIAFTFSGASGRFDARRNLAVDQINALSTAWMRLDLLPSADRTAARQLLYGYVDGLVRANEQGSDLDALARIVEELDQVQAQLWQLAVESAGRSERVYVAPLVLSPLNEAFDYSNSRLSAMRIHVQPEVVALLLLLALLSAALVGMSQAPKPKPDFMHILIFAAVISTAIYVILDFEFPRIGLITLDENLRFMSDFRAGLD